MMTPQQKSLLKKSLPVLLLLIVFMLFQNCGDIRVKGFGKDKPLMLTPTTSLIPREPDPDPTPESTPTPAPLTTPTPAPSPAIVDTGNGIQNPNPIVGTGGIAYETSGKPWRPLMGIYVGDYWVMGLNLGTTTGKGGLQILREDGSNINGNAFNGAAQNHDTCLMDAFRITIDLGLNPPKCAGRNHQWFALKGIRNNLIRIDDKSFLALITFDESSGDRNAIVRYELKTPPATAYPYPVMTHYQYGSFTQISKMGNNVAALKSDSLNKFYIFKTSDLTPVTTITVPNQIVYRPACTVDQGLVLHQSAGINMGMNSIFSAVDSLFQLTGFSTLGEYMNCQTEDGLLLGVEENHHASLFTFKIFEQVGTALIAKRSFPVPFAVADYAYFHHVNVNGHTVYNYRQFVWIDDKSATLPLYDTGMYNPPALNDVVINPKGFILQVYVDQIRISRLLVD